MAKTMPKTYYGLHFYEGPAEYKEPNKKPYRILLNEKTLRSMDPSFEGCPVYVRHKDEVNLDRIQEEADGYVIHSFYNEADGKHWCKFIIVSDKGHEAIRNGWTLSNAYRVESSGPGGVWNGIEYAQEVVTAKFEHLAIVPDPRYQESIVLTPSQFKSYNESQILALKKVANSGKETKMSKLFTLFKKSPIEQPDLGETLVKLDDGREVTIAECIRLANEKPAAPAMVTNDKDDKMKPEPKPEAGSKVEEHAEHKAKEDKDGSHKSEEEKEKQGHKEEEKGAAPQMANMDHHVQVNGKSMSVRDMYNEHGRMVKHFQDFSHFMKSYGNMGQFDGGEKDAKAAQDADKTQRNADLDGGEKDGVKAEASADKTKKNEIEPKVSPTFFEDLKDAPFRPQLAPTVNLEQVARGKARYGSN